MSSLSKLTAGFLGLFLVIVLLPTAMAINELYVEDVDFDDPYHAGDSIEMIVTLANRDQSKDVEDVDIKVWLEKSGSRITDKIKYTVVRIQEDSEEEIPLSLTLPRDTLPGTYLVKVTVDGELEDSGTDVFTSASVELDVEQEEHSVEILDILAPAKVNSGSYFDASVVLFNSGESNEKDLRLVLEIPELGVRKEISLLREFREGEEDQLYFKMDIPAEAESGLYLMRARVHNSELSTSYEQYIEVSGRDGAVSYEPPATGDLPTVKTVAAGTRGLYSLKIGNNDANAKSLSFELAGAQGWTSSYSVEPKFISLSPGESTELEVTVVPLKEAIGAYSFTLYVKEGSEIMGSEQLTANVVAGGLGGINLDGGLSAVLLAIVAVVVLFVVGKGLYKGSAKSSRKVEEIYY